MRELKEAIFRYVAGVLFCLAFLLEVPNYPFTFLAEKYRRYKFCKKCKECYLEDLINNPDVPDRDYEKVDFPLVSRLHVALVPLFKDAMKLFMKVSKIYDDDKYLAFSNEDVKVIYHEVSQTLLIVLDDDLGQYEEKLWDHVFINIINDLISELVKNEEITPAETRKIQDVKTIVCISVSDTSKLLEFHFRNWDTKEIMERITFQWEWSSYGTHISNYMEGYLPIRILSAAFWYFLIGVISHWAWLSTPWYLILIVYLFIPYLLWKAVKKAMKGVHINHGAEILS